MKQKLINIKNKKKKKKKNNNNNNKNNDINNNIINNKIHFPFGNYLGIWWCFPGENKTQVETPSWRLRTTSEAFVVVLRKL